jgi:DNA-binding NtrC family response regulator
LIESQCGTRRITIAGRSGTSLSVPKITVRVEEGPDKGNSASINGPVFLIGTMEPCDLRLTDNAVSRRHALVKLVPEGLVVEDLGSMNGTWLEGVRVQSAYLPTPARLRVGTTVLAFTVTSDEVVVVPGEREATEQMGMLGNSPAMRSVFTLIRQIASLDVPVLITGETGTGKELVARALHTAGSRAAKPFVVMDCGSIVPELLRSELFGHEKGAFTGADRLSKGILEEATGGTVFLDEIGEIELSLQPNLLRALEAKEVRRVGAVKAQSVDFRLIAATNRDLRKASQMGEFRSDLYYRLSCITVHLPPLRERPEDLRALADRFAQGLAARHHLPPPLIEEAAYAVLEGHTWSGNIRELKNVMEQVAGLAGGRLVTAAMVREALGPASAPPQYRPAPAGTMEDAEKLAMAAALEATGWNRKAAARKLGIAASTMFEKIRKFGLTPPEGARRRRE